jgi:hypothetical protein
LDEEDSQSGALAEAKSSTNAEHFSAVFQGKAKRIAEIKDTRMHHRLEQALVEWKDGSTAWVGIHDLNSAAQQHVRLRMHGKLDSDNDEEEEREDAEEENVLSKPKKRKRRRRALQTQNAASGQKVQDRRTREKRQKLKECEELDAKISMSL